MMPRVYATSYRLLIHLDPQVCYNKLVDPSVLAVYSSLHKHEASPTKLLEKKKELGLEIYDHFDAQDLFSSRLIITI